MLDFVEDELSDSEKKIFKKIVAFQFRGDADREVRNRAEILLLEEGTNRSEERENAN